MEPTAWIFSIQFEFWSRDSKIFQQYSQLVFTPGLVKNNNHFWHSNPHCYGNGNCGAREWNTQPFRFFSCRSCLMQTVDCFDSKRWFNCDQVLFNVFCVSVDTTAYIKRHNFWVSCFMSSVETPVRWGGKIKQLLIAYFLGNICAKNYF